MKSIELNEVYAFYTPKKFINIIICDHEISDEIHNNIDALSEHSSIFFIFNNSEKKIDFRKFTKLYGGCGFIVANKNPDLSKGDKLPIETLFKTLLYCKEVFESSYISITYLSKLNFSIKNFLEKVEKFRIKQIGAAVLNITRFSAEDLRVFYTIDEAEEIPRLKFWKGKKWEDGDDEVLWNAYKTHYSTSNIILLPIPIVSQLMEIWIGDKKNVIKSFKNYDDDFCSFASLISTNHLQYVNTDILDLEI